MVAKARAPTPLYHANMPRKSASSGKMRPEQPDWFLPEWMATLHVSQAKLAKACDWTPSTMHGIYHGRTSYYREIVNLIAVKLNIEPFELLMPPERAMAIRRMQEAAVTIAHDAEKAVDEAPPAGRTIRVVSAP